MTSPECVETVNKRKRNINHLQNPISILLKALAVVNICPLQDASTASTTRQSCHTLKRKIAIKQFEIIFTYFVCPYRIQDRRINVVMKDVRFSQRAVVMKSTIFWDISARSSLNFSWRFGRTFRLPPAQSVLLAACFHALFLLDLSSESNNEGEMFLRNVG
jgi:hypothetical protein